MFLGQLCDWAALGIRANGLSGDLMDATFRFRDPALRQSVKEDAELGREALSPTDEGSSAATGTFT